MTEENVTETENPAEVVEETVKEEPESGDKPEEKPKRPWYEKRIDRVTKEKHDLVRENAKKDEIIANLMAGKSEDGEKTNLSQAEIDALIDKRAKELVNVRAFDEKCNAVYEDGNEEFDDFKDAVANLGKLEMLTAPFLELVTDLDKPHAILHYLGTNPEEADRIQSLPPAKQALALAKLEGKLPEKKKEEKEISKAPPPIKPIDSSKAKGANWGTKYYDGMPQEEFEAWDDKTARKK